tara:strand:+ start:3521 stop:4045 length:525 start_codon:yes stop_codon:yes gene_type:complete
MKTVRDMYRAGGMNDEYGQGGMNEYKKSGKMPPQLLEYFKKKGKAKIKEYQSSGKYADDSFLQDMYDDASAIGMGLLNMFGGEGSLRDRYVLGYQNEQADDYARQRSGQAGKVDAIGAAVGELMSEIGRDYTYEPSSVQKTPFRDAARAYDRARMTNEERDALRREQEARMNRR